MKRLRRAIVLTATLAAPMVIMLNCSSEDTTNTGVPGSGTGAGLGVGGATGGGGAGTGAGLSIGGNGGSGGVIYNGGGGVPTSKVACDGQFFECGDLEDNDGDGRIDSQDLGCLGPCDNTEDSYYPNLPGAAASNCTLDCFWDNGDGAGDDECAWDHRCDTLSTGVAGPSGDTCMYNAGQSIKRSNGLASLSCAEALTANTQSKTCYDTCAPWAPNGCDCFGCCEFYKQSDGSPFTVFLGSRDDKKNGTCDVDSVEDPDKCRPCTQTPSCINTCKKCEYCIGKTTLPAECTPGGSGGNGSGGNGSGGSGGGDNEQCPAEYAPCDANGLCAGSAYCVTGCCIPVPG